MMLRLLIASSARYTTVSFRVQHCVQRLGNPCIYMRKMGLEATYSAYLLDFQACLVCKNANFISAISLLSTVETSCFFVSKSHISYV